jgi:hypothetical protein
MIKKLEDSWWTDDNGNTWGCRPENEEIIAKVNEIIEYINQKEQEK